MSRLFFGLNSIFFLSTAVFPILSRGYLSVLCVAKPFFRLALCLLLCLVVFLEALQKGGVPAAPSGTATLLRLSPSHLSYPWPLLPVTDFRYPRLPWLDGRCVQGPGTYSPRHGGCAITSESSFMESSCRLQSELRRVLGVCSASPPGLPLYPAIVTRVSPRT